MDLGDVARIILYAWLALSLCVYGYRLYRRFIGRGPQDADTAPIRAQDVGTTTRTAGTRLPRARPADGDPTTPATAASVPVRPTNEVSPPRDGSLVEAVIREELAARERQAAAGAGQADGDATAADDAAADDGPRTDTTAGPATATSGTEGGRDPAPTSHRSGLFAPRPAGRPTVADALEGVAMPCDLAPLIGGSTEIDPHRVVFVTSGHAAGVVGSRLADELERLGFVVDTTTETAATAQRGEVVVTIELYEDAGRANVDGERLFPTAPGGSVAVVLST